MMCYAIIGQSDSNEMSTGCYAYLIKIKCISIQQFGQPAGRSDMCDGNSQSQQSLQWTPLNNHQSEGSQS